MKRMFRGRNVERFECKQCARGLGIRIEKRIRHVFFYLRIVSMEEMDLGRCCHSSIVGSLSVMNSSFSNITITTKKRRLLHDTPADLVLSL